MMLRRLGLSRAMSIGCVQSASIANYLRLQQKRAMLLDSHCCPHKSLQERRLSQATKKLLICVFFGGCHRIHIPSASHAPSWLAVFRAFVRSPRSQPTLETLVLFDNE